MHVNACVCMYCTCVCMCLHVYVWVSTCTRLAASRSLNIPSHVHVLGCAHAEAQENIQHTKAGFREPNPGWFQTKSVGQRQCATRCMQNSRRANPQRTG